jgi:hypothetical protein
LNQWVLTPAIALWKFPKWEFTWECEGSFPHTLLHSQEHEMWLPSFPLGPRNLANLCLGHEPKAKVATITIVNKNNQQQLCKIKHLHNLIYFQFNNVVQSIIYFQPSLQHVHQVVRLLFLGKFATLNSKP